MLSKSKAKKKPNKTPQLYGPPSIRSGVGFESSTSLSSIPIYSNNNNNNVRKTTRKPTTPHYSISLTPAFNDPKSGVLILPLHHYASGKTSRLLQHTFSKRPELASNTTTLSLTTGYPSPCLNL